MKMQNRSLQIVFISALVLIGCQDYLDTQFPKVDLIDTVKSYTSESEIRHSLKVEDSLWVVVDSSGLSSKDRRPKFENKTVEVKAYSHLKCPGILHLHFFNDRLMEVRFFPEDFVIYLQAVEEEEKMKFSPDGKISIGPNKRVWYSTDTGSKKPFVGRADIRLEKQYWKWISKYS